MFVCIAHACCQPTPSPFSVLAVCSQFTHFLTKTQNRFNFIDVRRLHASCSKYRCCNIAYKHITKCNSVSLNVRVWDAASSGTTKCNAIQMRPNVARRFSDFATNSRAMTSMSMLYSLSLCTCRTARWLSRCWLIELRKYVFRRRSDEKLRSTKKLRGTNTLLVPQPKSWGDLSPRSLWLLRVCSGEGEEGAPPPFAGALHWLRLATSSLVLYKETVTYVSKVRILLYYTKNSSQKIIMRKI